MTENPQPRDLPEREDSPPEGSAPEPEASPQEFESDPARNPEEKTLRDIKGG